MLPGLYIHFPFCRTKCPYCNFYSQTSLSEIPDFLSALVKEMESVTATWGPFDTVYIGGGTPSILSVEQWEALLSAVRRYFFLIPGSEITAEANPGDVDPEYLRSLKEIGITRLNLGVQSLSPGVLNFLGRRHSAPQALSAMEACRGAGFEGWGMDLIYGVPGETMNSWAGNLTRAAAFSPEHISCYQLTLEGDTPLGSAHQKGKFALPPEEEWVGFFMFTSRYLEEEGYLHYEVSNFSKGARNSSRHNQKYWDHTPYLGLGPAAHSFSGRRRWWNHSSVSRYISALLSGNPPLEGSEDLSPEQLRLEAMFLRLRTKTGINVKDFYRDYDYDLLSEKGRVLIKMQEEGLLSFQNGRICPTRKGFTVADRMALM